MEHVDSCFTKEWTLKFCLHLWENYDRKIMERSVFPFLSNICGNVLHGCVLNGSMLKLFWQQNWWKSLSFWQYCFCVICAPQPRGTLIQYAAPASPTVSQAQPPQPTQQPPQQPHIHQVFPCEMFKSPNLLFQSSRPTTSLCPSPYYHHLSSSCSY